MDLRTMTPMPVPQDVIDADRESAESRRLIDFVCLLDATDRASYTACYALAHDEIMKEEVSWISIDPDNFWSARCLLVQLTRLAIRGNDIGTLYVDVCGKNAARMAGLLCAAHYRICGFKPMDIHRAIKAKDSKGIDFGSLMTGVKHTLPAFNIEAALEGKPDPD